MRNIALGIVVAFACLWVGKEILVPAAAAVLFSGEYGELVTECDTAMEASWYFKQGQGVLAESEKVQMLACHNYDKTRKLMLMSGLPVEYLAWLGLKALEINQRPAEEFAKPHRFLRR